MHLAACTKNIRWWAEEIERIHTTAKERLVFFIYFYSTYDVDRTKKMEATSGQSATQGVRCTY